MTYLNQAKVPRVYRFYYNNRGDVDSIRVTDANLTYLYRVYYTNAHLDSAVLYNATGAEESVNTEIEYTGHLITGYTYYLRTAFPYPYVHTIAYDNKYHVRLVDSRYFFTYDSSNNFIQSNWNPNTAPYATYTYDTGVNPLHYVRNLFVILVEEPFYWEYIFSQHNMLSKTYGDWVDTHTNEYNAQGQLIGKTIQSTTVYNNTEFTFSYYP